MANNGQLYAKKLNKIGFAQLNKEMKDFWINWDNESDEWRIEFVKTIKPEKMVYIMNHSN